MTMMCGMARCRGEAEVPSSGNSCRLPLPFNRGIWDSLFALFCVLAWKVRKRRRECSPVTAIRTIGYRVRPVRTIARSGRKDEARQQGEHSPNNRRLDFPVCFSPNNRRLDFLVCLRWLESRVWGYRVLCFCSSSGGWEDDAGPSEWCYDSSAHAL